ncbi:MAG: hypothetical protein KAJ78_09675 [Acidobacteria bacterium]|nr:hypothetical protein [Acidobacteriota bacterium]
MIRSSRWVFVVLALLLGSVVVGSGLLALEAYLAPFPGPDDTRTYDEAFDALEASTVRWQVIYLPLLQLGISVGVGLLIPGRLAWLENFGASLFVLGLVFVHHATVSFKSAWIFVPLYLVLGAVASTLVRRFSE